MDINFWRTYRYVLKADMIEMFRQILNVPAHRHFLNIVWFNAELKNYKYFKINTITYGLVPSLFLSIKTVNTFVQ